MAQRPGISDCVVDMGSGELKPKRLLGAKCLFVLLITFLPHIAQLVAHEPFLQSPSVLVLFVGLPGDVEHEKAYREQLQLWLGDAPPQKLVPPETSEARCATFTHSP